MKCRLSLQLPWALTFSTTLDVVDVERCMQRVCKTSAMGLALGIVIVDLRSVGIANAIAIVVIASTFAKAKAQTAINLPHFYREPRPAIDPQAL